MQSVRDVKPVEITALIARSNAGTVASCLLFVNQDKHLSLNIRGTRITGVGRIATAAEEDFLDGAAMSRSIELKVLIR